MKKVIFVADFFSNKLNGGAENNDNVLINFLEKKGLSVLRVNSNNLENQSFKKDNFFIISNFIGLSESHKKLLKNESYIIYEHDHKYLKSRDPSRYPDFQIPKDQLINVDFYKNAKAVVVLSEVCREIIIRNLKLDNVHNIGCSLWSDERLNFIRSLSDRKKNNKLAILNSTNRIKNTALSIDFCRSKGLEYDLIQPCNPEDLLNNLSRYDGLVFLPGVLETFSRISAEAKMLNCKLITKSRLLGFASEKIFDLQGLELIEEIRKRKNNALKLFYGLITK